MSFKATVNGSAWITIATSGRTCSKPRSPIRAAFWNTIRYVFFGVPIQLILALGIALLLMQVRRFAGFFRAAYFVPFVTSFVAVAFVWNWLYAPQVGLINQMLAALGLPKQHVPEQPLPGAARNHGSGGLAQHRLCHHYLSGRSPTDPGDVLRSGPASTAPTAGRFSGASRCRLLNPVIVYLGRAADHRLSAYVRPGAEHDRQGGPLNSTTTVVLEVYKEGFGSYNMGYAGALTVILFGLILLITVVQLRLLSRRVEY